MDKMTTTKRYDFRLLQKDDLWSAEIVRRVSVEKMVVSKHQDGFATEADAQTWATNEIAQFLKKYKEKNKVRSEKRKQNKIEQALLEKDKSAEKPVRVKSKWDLIKTSTKEIE